MQSQDLFGDVLLAFLAILPVVNPFSKPPIFLSITEGWTDAERRNEAFRASLYAFIILSVSLVAGTFVLAFFSISLPALQIAGGLLIARTAFQMLNPQKEHHQTQAEEHDAKQREDLSFVPLAMPLLSGPGSMAVMINLGTEVKFWAEWLIFIAAAGAVCIISFFVLAESTRLVRVLGVNGMNALSKLMGFLLLALAVQFILNGAGTTLQHLLATYRHAT
ncbi:MAG TPA: MarC family NAAT transporter [Candidatus Methylacidiphilales bacterium]|jgi:multiple antibiotic resistance protein|nr:MarC family NAAT transporter [Candidatus Methylacidiphilales bacterium]